MSQVYDYVIIGSGFGGSVSALRLIEKGYSVLVLEKGKTAFCGTPGSLMEELLERPIRGLCLPPILELVSGLRDYGYAVPYTLDADRLADTLEREIGS